MRLAFPRSGELLTVFVNKLKPAQKTNKIYKKIIESIYRCEKELTHFSFCSFDMHFRIKIPWKKTLKAI